ncbi:3-isopropylmalate dehydratase large subunit [Acidisphaera sp. L21]|uniref:3-isopropylmalate dehydratase large subunit n=1 Tax=Acidisphaera sp. L21 TaxID=1641851 RepID=UPI00131C7AF1|nr:3-isopropylmalate dehydratase large subunit [Acidisphaera sp. L21]
MATLFDKIWDAHVVGPRQDGRTLVYIDRHVIHDLHAPPAFAKLRKTGRDVRRPDLTVAVTDHMVATSTGRTTSTIPKSAPFLERTRSGALEFGIRLLGIDSPMQGIVHVISPELAIALPGSTVACPDSHACTVGGIGALGLATGTTEVVHVLATQTLAWNKPRQMRIVLDGGLAPDVTAKDVILFVIGHWGSDMARGHAVEFAGPVARALPVEGRMTLCNMVTELGGRAGLVAPDASVAAWLKGRAFAPQGTDWGQAVQAWKALYTDADAVFDQDLCIDCGTLEPQITWGIDPAHVIGLSGTVPNPETAPVAERAELRRALDYMQLQPGAPIAGVPVDRVFIGSCTNARLSDLQAAAAVVRGRHVAPGMHATVVPGSTMVKREAENLGLHQIFLDAGFDWGEAGCSMCAGVNGEEGSPGQRIVSTTNRNFAGRQGAGVMTHLASPETAAAAALAGCIVDRRAVQ